MLSGKMAQIATSTLRHIDTPTHGHTDEKRASQTPPLLGFYFMFMTAIIKKEKRKRKGKRKEKKEKKRKERKKGERKRKGKGKRRKGQQEICQSSLIYT
jgi:hypothetical protein